MINIHILSIPNSVRLFARRSISTALLLLTLLRLYGLLRFNCRFLLFCCCQLLGISFSFLVMGIRLFSTRLHRTDAACSRYRRHRFCCCCAVLLFICRPIRIRLLTAGQCSTSPSTSPSSQVVLYLKHTTGPGRVFSKFALGLQSFSECGRDSS